MLPKQYLIDVCAHKSWWLCINFIFGCYIVACLRKCVYTVYAYLNFLCNLFVYMVHGGKIEKKRKRLICPYILISLLRITEYILISSRVFSVLPWPLFDSFQSASLPSSLLSLSLSSSHGARWIRQGRSKRWRAVPAADATASASRPPRAAACLSAADSGLSDPSASLVVLIMEAGVRKAGHGGAVGSASEPGERGVIFTFDPNMRRAWGARATVVFFLFHPTK